MKLNFKILLLMVIFLALPLSACAPAAAPEEEIKPVTLEPVTGTDLNRLTLTEDAAKRLDVQTAEVREADGKMVVPYASILYEANGNTWIYVNVAPLVFVRQAIVIDSISGDEAILSKGPDSGSAVVTVGAAELYGSESEFEEE
jgi:hypothetical protein